MSDMNADVTVQPGDTVEATMTVANPEDESMTYAIRSALHPPDGGRRYRAGESSQQTVEVDPGETQEVELVLVVDKTYPEGEYDLILEAGVGKPGDEFTLIHDRHTAPETVEVVKPTGELGVTTTPSEASISVDGEVVGESPLTTELPIGNYTVVANRLDYEAVSGFVEISENETSTLSLDLTDPEPPFFDITSFVVPDNVEEGEEFVIEVGVTNVGDEPGEQSVTVTADTGIEFEETSNTIEVTGADSERIRVRATPTTAGERELTARTDDDEETRTISVASDQEERTVGDYTNSEGIVDTDGLRAAVSDWQAGDIDTDLLREVVAAWQSGEPIE
ncbi:PEGA domain-containing protein [Halobacteriaceae archaeon SHR40]|uniref:PEGA domain-containing protein n=1 Tax=Halovenus amylolytica TaxID=2500550 RepID=UPI000FE358A1